MERLTAHERELSIEQRFKLVAIAHEGEPPVRKWALDTLERATAPLMLYAAPGHAQAENPKPDTVDAWRDIERTVAGVVMICPRSAATLKSNDLQATDFHDPLCQIVFTIAVDFPELAVGRTHTEMFVERMLIYFPTVRMDAKTELLALAPRDRDMGKALRFARLLVSRRKTSEHTAERMSGLAAN